MSDYDIRNTVSYNLDIQDYNYGEAPRRASRFAVAPARAKAAGVSFPNIIDSKVMIAAIISIVIIAVAIIIQT